MAVLETSFQWQVFNSLSCLASVQAIKSMLAILTFIYYFLASKFGELLLTSLDQAVCGKRPRSDYMNHSLNQTCFMDVKVRR